MVDKINIWLIEFKKIIILEWSRELLLEKWMRNPVECCELAGVQAPVSVLTHAGSVDSSISTDTGSDRQEVMVKLNNINLFSINLKTYIYFPV